MIETLKKHARKSNTIHAVVCIVIVAILLAVTHFAIFDVATGPAKLDITQDPATYEGKYVTIDAEYFVYDYVEHTTTTTKKYGGKSTSINGYSYIVFQSIENEGDESTTWYFYSIYLDKKKQAEMSGKIDQALEYLGDDTDTVDPPEPVSITGVWTPMEPQLERYYRSALAEMEVVEGEYDKIYFYELDTKELGGFNRPLFWCMMAVALGLLLFGVYSIIGIFSNAYLKDINQYLKKDTSASMEAIGMDFSRAHLIGKRTWIGEKWTIYMVSSRAKLIANKDLLWGYYFRRTGRNSVSEMRLYAINKVIYHVPLSEKETHEALEYYGNEQPHRILGYNADLEKMFSKDFEQFKELKYNPVMREAAGEDAFKGI